MTLSVPLSPKVIDWKTPLERFALLIGWAIITGIFAVLIPDTFLTWRTFSTLFGSQAVLVVLSLALMVPLISGDFDLSSASTLVFAAMLVAVLNARLGLPVGLSVIVALTAGG